MVLRYYIKLKSIYTYNIELHHFSKYNRLNGWNQGDVYLTQFANFLNLLGTNMLVFRVEGDDFMILSETKSDTIVEQVKEYVNAQNEIITCSIEEKYIQDISKMPKEFYRH